ncbi:T-complex protein 11-domain-containing protein [Suillus clintonianus]|uniref:T-complex protein 11-domain-containing protein n=1 Tax=Suillus clintonianus TaxID=1904413 RepID=UPI001B863C5D|nr:T-complex protein 11-domain-containing protein [Suillus clintonianus]KAG2129098.1 T-complex protein 11-domain-containing protein [Suillus clintonianus]
MLLDPPSNAPRQPPSSPWISTDAARAVWPSPTDSSPVSPVTPTPTERAHKRPRVDTDNLPSFKTHRRPISSARTPSSPLTPWRSFRKTDSRPNVLNIDPHCTAIDCPSNSPLPVHPPVDLSSPHIPAMHPLINRQTLKELDLDSILRNPQLRHDLLFDAGLQFRPTSGRRKRELSDKYWSAIAQELETGCTCVSFDLQWKPHDLLCVCAQGPIPQVPSLTYCSPRRALTLRMPSRIRPLLTEFLEVLLFVIQPLTSICGTYANPATLQTQIEQHAAQAAHLRSLFDPELIQQELHHELFDPSGLFIVIGQTLKSHCAPMRDRLVDAMVEAAKACAPGCGGSKADAVKAVRVCLDILELMKLDIANHQLQTLRPFLIETAGQYELKAFKGRKGAGASLDLTRKWMQTAYHHLMSSHTLPHPSLPSNSINYRQLPQTQQIYLSVLKALTDLVFDPPCGPSPVPLLRVSKSTIPYLPLYPETTYLDGARLLVLSGEAADATAMYMFLLLFRQLVFSDPCEPTLKVTDAQLASLKKEIRDISSSHLGHCFTQGSNSDSDNEKWAKIRQDIVLQIAMRAKEARTSSTQNSSSDPQSRVLASAPDERMLKLAERWSDSNMRPNSPLSTLLRKRIRDVVFNQVVALTFPLRDSIMSPGKPLDFASVAPPSALASGMEPLVDEIRLLSERLSRLAHIHLGVYLPLYEQDDFSTSVFSCS